jgi:hypothetical protein
MKSLRPLIRNSQLGTETGFPSLALSLEDFHGFVDFVLNTHFSLASLASLGSSLRPYCTEANVIPHLAKAFFIPHSQQNKSMTNTEAHFF